MNTLTIVRLKYEVGQKIKEYRLKNRMTQEDLEEKSGITTRHISDIECGNCDLKLSTLFKICEALGVTLYDFFAIVEMVEN